MFRRNSHIPIHEAGPHNPSCATARAIGAAAGTDDFIGESNPVRVIDVLVDALDLTAMSFGGLSWRQLVGRRQNWLLSGNAGIDQAAAIKLSIPLPRLLHAPAFELGCNIRIDLRGGLQVGGAGGGLAGALACEAAAVE